MKHAAWLGCALALAACNEGERRADGALEVPALTYADPNPWTRGGASVPAPGPSGRLLVTNSLDDSMSLLEMDGLGTPGWAGELARVPVGLNPVELEGPHHTAVSPAGDYYYVGISNYVPGGGSGPHGAHGTGTADGYCLKLSAKDNRLVASARVDRNPGDVIVSADGRTLYQTHFDLLRIADVARQGGPEEDMVARLAILDADTMKVKSRVRVCPAPHAVRLSRDERTAYVACWSDEVAVVDLARDGTPVTRVKVASGAGTAINPRHQPYALTVSPTTGDVWVSSLASRQVQVLEPATRTMNPERTVYLRGSPMFGDFTKDGRTLYLPYQQEDAVAVIDAATSTVTRTVQLSQAGCLNVHQLMLTPDERHGVAVCEGDHIGPGTVHVVDLAEGTVVSTVKVGIFPDSVSLLRGQP
jgi:DNA-binding beta-propeller fold protein YncE